LKKPPKETKLHNNDRNTINFIYYTHNKK